jgi:hypothetical protein
MYQLRSREQRHKRRDRRHAQDLHDTGNQQNAEQFEVATSLHWRKEPGNLSKQLH